MMLMFKTIVIAINHIFGFISQIEAPSFRKIATLTSIRRRPR